MTDTTDERVEAILAEGFAEAYDLDEDPDPDRHDRGEGEDEP